jgi:hypothetical protein
MSELFSFLRYASCLQLLYRNLLAWHTHGTAAYYIHVIACNWHQCILWYSSWCTIQLTSLFPRPSLALPAFNVARKKREEEDLRGPGIGTWRHAWNVTDKWTWVGRRSTNHKNAFQMMPSSYFRLSLSGRARKYYGSWEVSKGYLLTVQ